MPRAISLRSDFSATELRRLARRSKDTVQARRLLALAAIYDGGTRSEAARLGNVTLQIVRDWALHFNAEEPDGLRDRKAAGPTPLLMGERFETRVFYVRGRSSAAARPTQPPMPVAAKPARQTR